MSRASPRFASRIVLVSGLAFGAFADDAVDALRNAIGAADAKAESVQKALQPVVEAAATAGLPPLSEGIEKYEESFESGAAEAARRADRGDAEKKGAAPAEGEEPDPAKRLQNIAKGSAEAARALDLLEVLRKGSLDLVDAVIKKGDAAGVNLVVSEYEKHTKKLDDLEKRDEDAHGKLADLSAKVYELEQAKAKFETQAKVGADKAEQAARVEAITQALEFRRELRLRLARAAGAMLSTAKGPDADRALAMLDKKVDGKAPPEDRIHWIDLYARLGRETIPSEVLDVAQQAARQWKVHEDEANKLRDKYEKAKEAYFKSIDPRTNKVAQATALAFEQLSKQMQAATAGQRDMDRLRLAAGRAVGASVAAVPEGKRDKLVDWALLAAQNEKELDTRCAIVESLGQLDDPKVREALRKWLVSEKETRVRLEALEALVQLKDAESMEVVRARLLAHENWRVRVAAVSALVRVPQKESVPALIAALEVEVGRVREDVTQALQRLTGQSLAMDANVWKRWWEQNGAAFKIEDVPKARRLAVSAWDQAAGGKVTFYGISSISKHVCFVIDISLSMKEPDATPGGKSKLDVAKEQLKQAVEGLSDGDTFSIVAFAGSVERWQSKMTKVSATNKDRAKKWIDNDLNLDMGTNIHAGMKAAFEIAGLGSRDSGYQSEIDTIFFMTDGQPTVGEVTDPLELRRLIREWNRLSRIRIHCIGVGKDPNIALLYGIAEDSGGQFQHH
jgi:hypothetical protein